MVKKCHGKYLIRVSSEKLVNTPPLAQENQQLKASNKLLHQEVQELNMLVNLYESKGPREKFNHPPDIPS